MKKLKINRQHWEDVYLLSANNNASAYLNLKTGKVIIIDEDIAFGLDDYSSAEDVVADDSVPDWQREILVDAFEVEHGNPDDFEPIPLRSSRDGYRDMEVFIETLEDEHLQELLEVAIRGKGAFRRFKDTLARYPDKLDAWYAFSDERDKQRMMDWFESIDIEPEFE